MPKKDPQPKPDDKRDHQKRKDPEPPKKREIKDPTPTDPRIDPGEIQA